MDSIFEEINKFRLDDEGFIDVINSLGSRMYLQEEISFKEQI